MHFPVELFVCFAVANLLACSSGLSCLSLNDAATVVPLGLIYRRPGEDLDLYCIANFSHNFFEPWNHYKSKDLLFTRVIGGDETAPLPSRVVNETTIVVHAHNLTTNDAARYFCKLRRRNGTEKPLCSSQLFIGVDPIELTDFSCISNGLESLDCTWTQPAEVIASTFYKVGYRILNDSRAIYYGCEKTTHPVENELNKFACSFSNSNYNSLSEELYFFISAKSPLNDTAVEMPVIKFNNFRNVRPYPPEKLTVHDVGQRNVSISFDIKDKLANLKDTNGLLHEIKWTSNFGEYEAFVDTDSFQQREIINTTDKNLKDLTVFHTLHNLSHPFAKYTLHVRSICGQAESENLWSDLTPVIEFQTLADVPGEVPFVPPGGYYFDGGHGALTIYWERVAPPSWNGPNFTYVIDYSDGVTRRRIEFTNESFAARLVGTTPARSLNFSVSTKNDAGMRQGPIVSVPSVNSEMLTVNVQMKKPGIHEVSWAPWDTSENILYYTVFYCEKKPPDGENQMCKTQPKWERFNNTVRKTEFSLAEDKFYLFAVNCMTDRGPSPLVWFFPEDEVEVSDRSFTLGLAIGLPIFFVVLLLLAYPTFLWARRKYKDITGVKVNVPKILTKDDLAPRDSKTFDWSEKRTTVYANGCAGVPKREGLSGLGVSVIYDGIDAEFGSKKEFCKTESNPYDIIESPGKDVKGIKEVRVSIADLPRLDDCDGEDEDEGIGVKVEEEDDHEVVRAMAPGGGNGPSGYVIVGDDAVKVVTVSSGDSRGSAPSLSSLETSSSTSTMAVAPAEAAPSPDGSVSSGDSASSSSTPTTPGRSCHYVRVGDGEAKVGESTGNEARCCREPPPPSAEFAYVRESTTVAPSTDAFAYVRESGPIRSPAVSISTQQTTGYVSAF